MPSVTEYTRILSRKVPPNRVRRDVHSTNTNTRGVIPLRAVDRHARGVSFGVVKTKYITLTDLASLYGLDRLAVKSWYDSGILPKPFMCVPRKCHGKTVTYPIYVLAQAQVIVATFNTIYAAGYRRLSMSAHHDVLSEMHHLADAAAARFLKRVQRRNGVHGLNELQIKWYNRRG